MRPLKNKTLLLLLILFFTYNKSYSQAVLSADGPGNTYELINSIFAPNYIAVEAPDQCTSHPSFGRHIAEVWDSSLNKYVFEFYIHLPTSFPVTANTADNDRCINFDRQRIEIKTYDQSPDSLKGTIGETVTYKWKFKIPTGFKPSSAFTHIHQVKAVGGDESDPIFTLTVRKGNPNKLEVNYVADSSSGTTKLGNLNLSLFENIWVEATEVIKVGSNGTYSINIKNISDHTTIFSYTSSNMKTIRPSNNFIRPKWGIYRSLSYPNDLRDESIRMTDYSITEIIPTITISANSTSACAGNNINFTASTNNGGSNPFFQWKKNGANIGSNNGTLIINNFSSGDIITCLLTSNDPNAFPATAISNSIVINLKQTSSSVTNLSVCPSQLPYTWNGLVFNNSASQSKIGLMNAAGCDSIATLNLTVKSISSSTTYQNICPNQLPYFWNGNNYLSSGTYHVQLTNFLGCDSVATLILTVGNAVTPSVSINTSSNIICSGSDATFSATSTNGGTSPIFQWKKNGNNIGSASSIQFTAGTLNTGDIISCILTSNNLCQTTSVAYSNSIQITVIPSPQIGLSSNVGTFCEIGAIKNIYNSNTVNGGYWLSSNPSIASVSTDGNSYTGTITAKSNGTTTVIFNTVGANGCVSNSNAVTVTVAQATTPNAITGTNQVCVGNTTTLATTTTGGVWSSSNNRGTIDGNGIYTGSNAGAGVVRYTVTNANSCSAYASYNVTVNAIPAVPTIAYAGGTNNPQAGAPSGSFCVGKTFTVVGSPNSPAGVWSATGVASVTSGGVVTINAVGAGSIKYTYTSTGGCSSSRTISGNGFTCAARGVNMVDGQLSTVNGFTIYPNPTKSVINLQLETLVGAGSIIITDLYGKTVKTQILSIGINTIDIATLSKGIYFVSSITSNGKTTKKLVVE